MKKKSNRQKKRRGLALLFSIIMIFCVFGTIVFAVSRRISKEMSASAIQNLSESLNLIESTIEAILRSEAEFQKLIAQEITMIEDPEEFIRSYKKNGTMVRISLILEGEAEGVSNVGKPFRRKALIFSRKEYRRAFGFPILSEQPGDMGIHHQVPGAEGGRGDCCPLYGIYLRFF